MDAVVREEIEGQLPAELRLLVEFYALEPLGAAYDLLTDCIEAEELGATRRVFSTLWAEGSLRVVRDDAGRLQASCAGSELATAWAEMCGRDLRDLLKYASTECREVLEAVCGWLGLDLASVTRLRCGASLDCSAPGNECECCSMYHAGESAGFLCGTHAAEQRWSPCGRCGAWYCGDCLDDCFALEGPPECARCPAFVCPGCQDQNKEVCAACLGPTPGAKKRRRRRTGRRAGRRKRNTARRRARERKSPSVPGSAR